MDPDRVVPLASSGVERGLALAYSPDGSTLAVGISSGIILFEARTLELLELIETNTWARSLAFSPDGSWLAAGLFDNTIRLYEMPAGKAVTTITGHTGWVRQVAFTPDGTALVSVSDDNSLRLWSLLDGKQLDQLQEGLLEPRTFAISPRGNLLAVGMRDGSISLFQFDNLSFLRRLTGHTDWVRCLTFSPDGSLLASGAFDRQILLWDPTDGNLLEELAGHSSSVLDLAFSPDGDLLASASVDQTVRIWNMPEGSPMSALVGHEDFVYAVEFAPDGKTILSAGGDNTLRLWDAAESIRLSAATGYYPPGSQPVPVGSDCRSCHHPSGESAPPRVTEMRCETCHTQGAGLSFCPIFPISPEAEGAGIGYRGDVGKAGFPVGVQDLAVKIATPSNGEGLFTKGLYVAPATVAGRVYAPAGTLKGTTLRLQAWAEDELVTDFTIPLSEDGIFKVRLSINPDGDEPISGKGGDHFCNSCHEDFAPQGALPEGEVHLRVTASTPDGRQAFDERWFTVEVTGDADVQVRVRDAESGLPLKGAPVSATAVQYTWRSRYTRGSTDKDGTLNLTLEALSENPTTYSFSVPETIVDGVLFAGIETVEVTIPPGSRTVPDVSISARALKGDLSGVVTSAEGSPLPATVVWAVRLPAGPAVSMRTDTFGRFAFTGLDLTRYRLVARATDGDSAVADIDLIESPSTNQDLALSLPHLPAFRALDEGGKALPFSWLMDEETGKAVGSDPLNGVVLVDDLRPGSNLRVAAVPGYYSQIVRLDPNDLKEPAEVTLKRSSNLQQLAWGNGQVFLPAQTRYEVAGGRIDLSWGWIWGNGEGEAPLEIQIKDGWVAVRRGMFAIEARSDGEAWLYLYEGNAVVQIGTSQPIQVDEGQMILLSEEVEPIRMEEAWASALHRPGRSLPEVEFEPGLAARARDSLNKLGVGTAQTLTLTAYLVMLALIAALPILKIYLYLRNRPRGPKENHPKENE